MSGIVQSIISSFKAAESSFVAPTYTTDSQCVLYYDPANPLSYSGSGTALNNLADGTFAGTSATVVNATYNNSLNSGVFTFAGSAGNQYIMTPNLGAYFGTLVSDMTIEMWVYATAYSGALMEVGQNSISTGWRTNVIELGNPPGVGSQFWARGGYINVSNNMVANDSTTGAGVNRWMNLSLVLEFGTGFTKGPIMYYNGNVGATTNKGERKFPQNQSPLLAGQTSGYFGWAFGAGSSSQNDLGLVRTTAMFTGRMGIIRVYNTALSQSQIQSNFDAAKARYGL